MILVYCRKGTFKWANEFVQFFKLEGENSYSFSELKFGSNLSLYSAFYYAIDFNKSYNNFDDIEINDIIARCRLLRSLPRKLAVKMIIAIDYSVNSMFDEVNPKYIVSLRVDSYVLDIIERSSKKRGIIFLGIWKSAFKMRYFFVTSRGELNYLQVSFENVVKENDITNRDFKAVSIIKSKKFTKLESLKIKIYDLARSYYLTAVKYLLNDRLGYRYLTNSFIVQDYNISLMEISYDKFIKDDWRHLLESKNLDKNIFVALQVNPESTIDYYVNDLELVDYEVVLIKFIESFVNTDYFIFIKDHPNMYGRRNYKFLKEITSFHNVRLVPYEISSNYILEFTKIVFTWSGTISVQAVLADKISLVVNPPYYIDGMYIQIKCLNDIRNIVKLISDHKFPEDFRAKKNQLLSLINSSLYLGDLNFKNPDKRLFKSVLAIIKNNLAF